MSRLPTFADLDEIHRGEEAWKVVAPVDARGLLTGHFMLRLPSRNMLWAPLAEYRELRGIIPHSTYLSLRACKKAFEAEQAGIVGRA
ncbi:hypothetical protein [Lysobacter enzymogenes]|uniref:hypothetical protein n=1 Tax=Lysobacter enzymogenes TaxID=69 RepID=UPI001A95BD8C|nr:hypothetical protein [Lysobacter enzymogenes]QQP97940.1 hypothetical protein JHW38_08035 [Lysobacter enzymogenes]